jgi:undecaprenyl diphosphate synthase
MENQDLDYVLPTGTKIPQHIAFIPDGNMRWAKKYDKSYIQGIDAGAKALMDAVEASQKLGVKYITAWGFSTENWKRDPRLVAQLMKRVLKELLDNREKYIKQGVRFRHLGSLNNLPEALVNEFKALERATQDCTKHYFNIAFNYGGRNELLRTVQKIIKKGYKAKEITEDLIESMLDTNGIPDPDLIIRTSGEIRLSGLLPWQSVYSELYFTKTLWPDFSKKDLINAIIDYSNRDRRFGGKQTY